MKKLLLLLVPVMLLRCGDGDGDDNVNIIEDPNQPMIGEWQQISELRYDFEEGTGDGRACLGELDPELPSKIFAYSNGKLICTFMNALGEMVNLIPYNRKNYFLWVEIGNKLDLKEITCFLTQQTKNLMKKLITLNLAVINHNLRMIRVRLFKFGNANSLC